MPDEYNSVKIDKKVHSSNILNHTMIVHNIVKQAKQKTCHVKKRRQGLSTTFKLYLLRA